MELYLKRMHPYAAVVYFAAVTVITMFAGEPILMLTSFLFAFALNFLSAGAMKTLKTLLVLMPFAVLVAIINPLISHFGRTVLFFVFGQAYTLESLLYGANLAITLMAVVLHFAALGSIVDVEKILFLIGRIAPSIALLISVTVKNITSVGRRLSEADEAQEALGYYSTPKTGKRLIHKLKTFSTVIALSLEDAVETAIAMRGKCYGVKRRTSAGGRRMSLNDVAVMIFTFALAAATFFALGNGAAEYEFFPTIALAEADGMRYLAYICFAVMCTLPMIITWKEELKWKCLISRI